MRNRLRCGIGATLAVVATLLAMLSPVRPVAADVAPPWYAQGATIGPGETPTYVQMVSEEVLLVIEGRTLADPDRQGLAANLMVGHVSATFVMRNQGEVEESFDVWFPLSTPDGFGRISQVESFSASVDGVAAAVTEQMGPGRWDEIVPWATWPVTFPPGQDVVLSVGYDVLPVGYAPYGTFHYVLDTGAGWWGSIGQGTVTARLPYPVDEYNAVLNADSTSDTAPNPAGFTVSGSEVVWQFSDLEPTAESNIRLTILAPSRWEAVVAGQNAVALNPDSAEAWLQLARAAWDVLQFRYGLLLIGRSAEIASWVDEAYQQAIRLAPEDVGIHVEYLRYMQESCSVEGPPPEQFGPVLEQALALAPDDEDVAELARWAELVGLPVTTPAAPTIIAPQPTTPPTEEPSVTPSEPPPTLPATPESDAQDGGGLCATALAPAAAIPAALWVRGRRRRDAGQTPPAQS